MIVFRDKPAQALIGAIEAAGHSIKGITEADRSFRWEVDDEVAVQAIIDAWTVEDEQDAKCAEIDAYAREVRERVIGDAAPAEMASWGSKRVEAQAFTRSENAADAPMLAREAEVRGIPLSEIVQRVTTQVDMLAEAEAVIAGVAGKHKDAVRALNDFAAIARYDFSTGWPA